MSVAAADRAWAAGLLLPVAIAGLFSFVRLAAERDDVPHDEDYVAAREAIASAGFRTAADAVAVLPPWSLRAHKELKGFEPISGDDLARRPLERYARLFVVVEPDAERYLDPLLERLGDPASREQRGRVEVLRFDLGEKRVVYDLSAELARAEIAVRRGAEEVLRCDRPARGGLACQGGKGWQRVTREHLLVSENSQRVVWSHPPAPGEVLEMTWREVPVSDVLVFSGGHTRDGAAAARAPVDVEVVIGEEKIAELAFVPRFSFEATRIDTSRFAGTKQDVRFRVSSKDHGKNHWAFDAFMATRGAP